MGKKYGTNHIFYPIPCTHILYPHQLSLFLTIYYKYSIPYIAILYIKSFLECNAVTMGFLIRSYEKTIYIVYWLIFHLTFRESLRTLVVITISSFLGDTVYIFSSVIGSRGNLDF